MPSDAARMPSLAQEKPQQAIDNKSLNLLIAVFRDTYTIMSTHPSLSKSNGFVLPYVLAVIAILAITTSIAATRLQSITRSLLALEAHNHLELSFANAQAESIFALITSIDAKRAINLSPDASVSTGFGILDEIRNARQSTQEKIEDDFWPINHGLRLHRSANHTVVISLQDTTGLISINGAPDKDIQALLIANGLTNSKARQVSARMKDYRDLDNKRRYLGAERADYRMRKMPPPTNAPFRSYQELKQVFGWNDDAKTLDMDGLIETTTLHKHILTRPAFAPKAVADILKLGQYDATKKTVIDDFEQIHSLSTYPSTQFRLCFTAKSNTNAGPVKDRRCMEIKRTANGIYAPFKKFWVSRRRMIDTSSANSKPSRHNQFENISLDKVKNVLHAPSFHAP